MKEKYNKSVPVVSQSKLAYSTIGITSSIAVATISIHYQLTLLAVLLLPIVTLLLILVVYLVNEVSNARSSVGELSSKFSRYNAEQMELLLEINESTKKQELTRRSIESQLLQTKNIRYEPELNLGEAEIYIDYSILTTPHFTQLLSLINDTYACLYLMPYENSDMEIKRSPYHHMSSWEIETIFRKINPDDILVIESIDTISSVEIKLKTGWIPSIYNNQNNVVVELPKGVVVLGLLVTLISVAVEHGTSNLKEIIEISEYELRHRKLELENEKLMLEIEKLKSDIKENKQQRQSLEENIEELLRLTRGKKEIKQFSIRGGGELLYRNRSYWRTEVPYKR